jgi:hypothetical protein
MTEEKKEHKNEFGEDINWQVGSDATYELNLQGPKKGGQMTRDHSHADVVKGDEKSQTKEDGYVDAATFAEGGTGAYTLKVSGKVNNARIVRMHRCDE